MSPLVSDWAVVINEQQESFKVQDLERKIATMPSRSISHTFLKN
jgi:hypothetical protein